MIFSVQTNPINLKQFTMNKICFQIFSSWASAILTKYSEPEHFLQSETILPPNEETIPLCNFVQTTFFKFDRQWYALDETKNFVKDPRISGGWLYVRWSWWKSITGVADEFFSQWIFLRMMVR